MEDDLTTLLPVADQAMSMLIEKESLDEDTFIISLIESISGKKVEKCFSEKIRSIVVPVGRSEFKRSIVSKRLPVGHPAENSSKTFTIVDLLATGIVALSPLF